MPENHYLSVAALSSQTAWAVVLTLSIVWVFLGFYWGRKAKDSEGFMLAGRNIGLAFGSATVMATWITSNTIMLAPQFAYEQGLWGVLAYATASFGLFLFAPMAVRIRKLLPEGTTAGDFFHLKFGKAGWVLFLIITLVYSLSWLVTMAVAGGELLNVLTGIDYKVGMSIILLVCVLYTLFGGLYAVVGTDFIQSLIILFGIILIGALVLTRIDIPETHSLLAERQPMLMQSYMPVALLSFFNIMLFGFGEVFHNNVWWSRTFAMREGIAPKAFTLAGLCWFPIPIAAGFIALSAGPLGINVTNTNQIGPAVAQYVLADAGFGAISGILILVVLFCSIASSIDSLLAATSDLLLKDVPQHAFGKKLTEASFRKAASLVIIGTGLVAWALALPRLPLYQILYASGPLVASLIWPVIGGLFWKRLHRPTVLLGIILACATGLYFYFAIGWYTASLVGAAVSMLMTLIARIIPKSD
ncbi:MAG: urea transporter [Verrucomicrobiota bacterium JB023]|nr:urea transporter [Verrucomicrobiota bacterium JB023]